MRTALVKLVVISIAALEMEGVKTRCASDIIIGFRIEIRHSNRLSELGLKMARPGTLWDMLQEEIILRLYR